MSPKEAVEKSIEIMIHQLKAITGFKDVSEEPAVAATESTSTGDAEVDPDVLKTRIENVDLSPRTMTALEEASIRTVGGLVRKKKDDILSLDGIGPKGLDEIVSLLKGMGLTLAE